VIDSGAFAFICGPPNSRVTTDFLWSAWFAWRLRSEAGRGGGRLEMARSARLRTRVIFCGRGTLRIGEHAVLGDREAGMPAAPIFFAPRAAESLISIGARTRIANGVELNALERIEIGEECLIGAGTRILDADFHGVAPADRASCGAAGAVRIGDRAWIGMGATVLKRVGIGEGAVIAAGAVVSADVDDGAVAGGNPARVISRWAAAR